MARPATPIDWRPDTPREAVYRRVAAGLALLSNAFEELATLERASELEPTPLLPEYVRPTEAARRFGWHADTITRWAREGRVRATGRGAGLRVNATDLETLARHRAGADIRPQQRRTSGAGN